MFQVKHYFVNLWENSEHLVATKRVLHYMTIFTFCSWWCFTERNEPMKIGTIACKKRLKYAIDIPSTVAGILAVALAAVSFKVAFAATSISTLSAMLHVNVQTTGSCLHHVSLWPSWPRFHPRPTLVPRTCIISVLVRYQEEYVTCYCIVLYCTTFFTCRIQTHHT